MPELRKDTPARGMDSIADTPPTLKSGLAIHVRDGRIIDGGDMVDTHTLSHDQADACLGTAAVIADDILAGVYGGVCLSVVYAISLSV